MNEAGQTVPQSRRVLEYKEEPTGIDSLKDDEGDEMPRKYYVDGGEGKIIKELVYDLDPYTEKLRLIKLIDYTGEEIRSIYQSDTEVRQRWADLAQRDEIMQALKDHGIDFEELKQATEQPDADPLDLLYHLAFNAPLLTRRERAEKLKRERHDFFDQYGSEARTVLEALLEKYAIHGTEQFAFPDVLKIPPISDFGNVVEIANYFGGAENLKQAVKQLQSLLYVA